MAEQQDDQRTEHSREVLIPLEQAEIPFYDRTIVAVRLPDGRIAAVLSVLCEVIGLAPAPQGRRIRADEVLAEQLLLAQVQTNGGPQAMDVLTAWAIPAWLQGIKLGKVAPEKRAARRIAAVLSAHVEPAPSWHVRLRTQRRCGRSAIPARHRYRQTLAHPMARALDGGRQWLAGQGRSVERSRARPSVT